MDPGGLGLAGDEAAVGHVGPGSRVARHLALFAAVECRVVEEGADFTVPLGPFEVLIRLGSWRGLGALLF